MDTPTGLRERKKRQTRQRISRIALDLFSERGFDQVPVSEIARRAEVSEATVFNYFPRKESLVYEGMESYEADLLEHVRNRPAGTSILTAFGSYVLTPRGALISDNPADMERVAVAARIIVDSPTLQARERQINEHSTRALADLILEELDPGSSAAEAWVAASALMAVNAAMKDLVHRYALAGAHGPDIAEDVVAQGRRALSLVEYGLAGRLPDSPTPPEG